MTSFKYSALSPDGARVSGVINAIDEYAAVDKIKAKYPVVLKIEEIKDSFWNRLMEFEIGSKYDAKYISFLLEPLLSPFTFSLYKSFADSYSYLSVFIR